MKKDLRMLAELRKGPLAGMDEDEFKMIEADVKKFGFKGLSGYAKSMVMESMRRMGTEINKALAQRKTELDKHGDHDQSDHGAWASGGGAGSESESSGSKGGSDKYETKGGVEISSGSYHRVDTKTTPGTLDKLFGKGEDLRQADEFEPKVTEQWTAKFTDKETGTSFTAAIYDSMRYDEEGLTAEQGFKMPLIPRGKSYDFHIGTETKQQAEIVRDYIDSASKKTNKQEIQKATSVSQGDMVSWGSSGGNARGKVVRVERSGRLSVPGSSFNLQGTKDDPAVLITLYKDGKPTDKKVGHKMSTLNKIQFQGLMKAKDKKTLEILREGPLSILPEQEYKMIEDAVKEYGIDGVTGYAASMIADGMRRMAFGMKKYAIQKAKDVNVGDVVLYAVKKPPQATTYATGKVESIKTTGTVSIAGTDESQEATEDKPIATIRVYAETESGLQETDRRVAKPVSELRMTDKKIEKSTESTLRDKVSEHNESVGDVKSKRTSLSVLQQVYDRGVGAYASNPSSVRPNVTGREQWAMGRVNGFLHALRTGRFKRSPYDQDLLPEGHRYASDDKKKT